MFNRRLQNICIYFRFTDPIRSDLPMHFIEVELNETRFPNLRGRTILQIIPDLDEGGAERTTIEVAEAIVEAGGKAIVASQGGRLESELSDVGGQLIKLPLGTKNLFNLKINAKRIADLIRANEVDIVHARSRAPAWSARWATQSTSARFVTTYHGAYSSNNFIKTKYNAVMASGDHVIANSEWIANHISRVHKIDSSRLTVIPRGVDFDVFDPKTVSSERVQSVRTAWGIGTQQQNETLVLLPGRLTPWKGHLHVLDALKMLSEEIQSKLILIFAGDSERKPRFTRTVREKIRALGFEDQVRFSGFTPDMPAAYLASDIVLTPSVRPEAFGRTAAEAGAMGKPVIACDHGGAKEIVDHKITGLLVTPDDRLGLAEAIGILINATPEERSSMGRAAMGRIRQNFSKRSLQYSTLKVYASLLRS